MTAPRIRAALRRIWRALSWLWSPHVWTERNTTPTSDEWRRHKHKADPMQAIIDERNGKEPRDD